RGVSKIREASSADRATASAMSRGEHEAFHGLHGRRLALIAVLFMVGSVLVLWRSGWIDRFFAEDASALEVELGLLDGHLDISVEKSWGSYAIEIRRGPEFPTDNDGFDALRASAKTPTERATYSALAEGDELWLRLENRDGKVLEAQPFRVRSFLSDASEKIEVKLAGRMDAKTLRVALDSGKKPQ
nr:hypothetical protein [Planctomycetota bacterium]